MSEAVRDSVVVHADPDTIMDVIADFEAYPEWQEEFTEVETLETDEDGWGTRVRFVVDAKAFRATMVLAYTYTDTQMSWVLVEGDPIRKNSGSYTLVERGDGTTEVIYELEMDLKIAVPGFLKRQAAKRIVDGALRAMKQRVESR